MLHVLPHAGGGMGAVLRSLLAAEGRYESPFRHSVAALEDLNEPTRTRLETLDIPWAERLDGQRLSSCVTAADIVLVHWWNHPLLMRALFEGLPPARLIVWSHVNGFYPPQSFFPELFELPDFFVFATESSMQASAVLELPELLRRRLRVLRSCAGIPEGAGSLCEKTEPFVIGYVGTVEDLKIHPDFLQLCSAAKTQERSVVAGGPDHQALRAKAEKLGLADRFEILGPVPDPRPLFRRLHAFAYPLAPRHYGTGEQVLIEAMAFGAVPVVLANPPEMAIVRHGETGIVAKSGAEFSAALRSLRDDPVERRRLAVNGHRYVVEECGIEHSTRAFHDLFHEALNFPKRPRKLSLTASEGVRPGSPYHLFLSSCGRTPERALFERGGDARLPNAVRSGFACEGRGTPFHYLRALGPDPQLERLCEMCLAPAPSMS